MLHPEFPPIAFLSAFSLLLPLPWHWRARNIGTLAIIFWLFISNMIYGIDALLWGDNVEVKLKVWCDITTKLLIGANFALPSACLCICIHLEQVASVRLAQSTFADKKRRQLFETFMCFGLPIICMAIHYVVQGHRYDIIEGYGCRPATYFSIPGLFIVWLPPIIMSVVAIVFAGLALRHFMRRRLSFAAHLHASNSALTPSRYLRLMTMAVLQMVWTITATAYTLSFMFITSPLRPWTTWADVHSDWLRVDGFPDILSPPIVRRTFYVLWWLIPVSTFLFVVFFSFGKDAMDEYKKCFSWVQTHILRLNHNSSEKKRTFLVLPSFKKQSIHDLYISKPTPLSSTGSYMTDLPPYETTPSSFSMNNASPTLEDFDEKTLPELPTLSYKQPAAIGSYSDLTPPTPSTMVGTSSPSAFKFALPPTSPQTPAPLTPPPANPRLRPLLLNSSPSPSARPLTYPYFEPSQRYTISSDSS
ncbi:pheromone A receptor-domain-containing protein [Crepidotus variabilis]|uniref:Pheromone A receptor-domain-containing protein n=1 Tax=Crepidotus variabilis TaxID=179855 RepID=A0A9P6E4W8_9AGAR|nr:pheromone A receptor-domain-containing protein [Crepidotus variabilis]